MVSVVCRKCLGKKFNIEVINSKCSCYLKSINNNLNCRYCFSTGIIKEEKITYCNVCNGKGYINY